ncbi:hypothetical protein KFK09_021942 [Dendrobium nobile]|uniref:Uncharacterized protein n=1 Tax=Dendrobium nobile TaxID=94219 RepID=A0A8T3AHC3_DENNO|nr:hypothetical protein KFK09_021942 [Dendrobium nobile]
MKDSCVDQNDWLDESFASACGGDGDDIDGVENEHHGMLKVSRIVQKAFAIGGGKCPNLDNDGAGSCSPPGWSFACWQPWWLIISFWLDIGGPSFRYEMMLVSLEVIFGMVCGLLPPMDGPGRASR